jgi:hypothetical protein
MICEFCEYEFEGDDRYGCPNCNGEGLDTMTGDLFGKRFPLRRRLRVLVACEYSGAVRDAFRALGHDAMSCDILPAEAAGPHYEGDVRDVLYDGWDIMIAFPPCTYLCASGLHWNKRRPGRAQQTEDALDFVRLLLDAPIDMIALENPVGCISTRIRKYTQSIQPHQFGADASKQTCLWLKNLPALVPTENVLPRMVDGRPRWSNQTDSGQNRLPPSETRAHERSKTYLGIAQAMAAQWGGTVLETRR